MESNGKYVMYRDNRTGRVDDVNEWEWEDIQRNPNKSDLKYNLKYIRTIDVKNINMTGESPPILEDELECPLCGYIAPSEKKLTQHKVKIHA